MGMSKSSYISHGLVFWKAATLEDDVARDESLETGENILEESVPESAGLVGAVILTVIKGRVQA